MKLFYSSTSPYARKVRIAIREKNLLTQVEEVDIGSSLQDPPALRAANPAGKVPAFIDGRGVAWSDSRLITELVDSLSDETPLLPPDKATRLEVLRHAALAEGILDAAFLLTMETRSRAEQARSSMWQDRWRRAIAESLEAIEGQLAGFSNGFDLAAIGLKAALDYVDFRIGDLDWKAGHPVLAAWQQQWDDRASVQETRPPAS